MRTFGDWYEIVSDKPGTRFFLTVRSGRPWVEAVDTMLCDLYGEQLQDKLDLWVEAQKRGQERAGKRLSA